MGGWNLFGYLILAAVGAALLALGDLAGRAVGAVLLAMSVAMVGLAVTRLSRARQRDRARTRV